MKFFRPNNSTLEIIASYDELSDRGLDISNFESIDPSTNLVDKILDAFDIDKDQLPGKGKGFLQINVTVNQDDVEFQMVSEFRPQTIDEFFFVADDAVPEFITNMVNGVDNIRKTSIQPDFNEVFKQANSVTNQAGNLHYLISFDSFNELMEYVASVNFEIINGLSNLYKNENNFTLDFQLIDEKTFALLLDMAYEFNGVVESGVSQVSTGEMIYSNLAFEILKSSQF
ncbi:MAG: adaptor protein MecA [Lactobacillaceae bacterium]|jgi:negative regulator of genetic competence, sporulation and motility|nr:adaptor protein MecA [Lactobacillaceae bacterium]